MSLPSRWTDKIFDKLTLIYGRDFSARWEGMNICDVKTDWSHELSGYENRPKAIAWALQNLPEGKPPTVLEFRKLCNTLPQDAAVFLEAPKADPERVKAALATMAAPLPKSDMKDWARRIVAENDEKRVYRLKLAKAALRYEVTA